MVGRAAILVLFPLVAAAEPGPAPREVRLDRNGHPLPAGAIARFGTPSAPLPAQPVGATVLRWSGDGRRLLVVWPGAPRRPDLLTIWDVRTADVVWRFSPRETVEAVGFDHAGTTVRCCLDGNVYRRWDVRDPRNEAVALLYSSPAASQYHAQAFGPDGRLAVQHHTKEDIRLVVYDGDGRVESRLSRRWADLGPDRPSGSYIRAGGATVVGPGGRRFDLAAGRELPPLQCGAGPDLTAVIPTDLPACVAGRTGAGSDAGGRVWEVLTGGLIAALPAGRPDCDRGALSGDGRILALPLGADVETHDLLTGTATRRATGSAVSAVAFHPGGSVLATAQADGTVLLWDVARPTTPWRPGSADRLWDALAATDPAPAWQALWHLRDHPAEATEFLAARLTPVARLDATADLIARLDHPRYAVRERAVADLAGRGELVEEDLRAAARTPRSAEQQARAQELLRRLDPKAPPSGGVLRALRCVWLLGAIGTPEAKRLLVEVADGCSSVRLASEAKAALGRAPK